MTRRQLRVGDRVEWTSQAGGHSKVKVGKVAAVVPAGQDPSAVWMALAALPGTRHHVVRLGGAGARGHESYLVTVDGPSATSSPRIYCPRVSALTLRPR